MANKTTTTTAVTFKTVQSDPQLSTDSIRAMVTAFQTRKAPDGDGKDVDAMKLFKTFDRTLRRLRNLKLASNYDDAKVTLAQKIVDNGPQLEATVGDLAFSWRWTKDGKRYLVTRNGETVYDGVKWNDARKALAPAKEAEEPIAKAAAPKKPTKKAPAKKGAKATKTTKAVKAVKSPVVEKPAEEPTQTEPYADELPPDLG